MSTGEGRAERVPRWGGGSGPVMAGGCREKVWCLSLTWNRVLSVWKRMRTEDSLS